MLRLALLGNPEVMTRYERATRWFPDLQTCRVSLAESAACDAIVLCDADPMLIAQSSTIAKPHLIAGPLGHTYAEAKRNHGLLTHSGFPVMIGQEVRFLPSLRAVKESVDAGRLGTPGLLRIHRWEPLTRLTPGRLTPELDLACWFFARRPTEVFAFHRSREGRDVWQVHLGFAPGGMALLDWAGTLPPGDGYFSLSLLGSTGAAYADDHHDRQLLFSGGQPTAPCPDQRGAALRAQLQEFVRVVREKTLPSVGSIDELLAMQVAEEAALSATNGKVITDGLVTEDLT